jgi:three-Cys-motif partner protein
LEAEVNKLPEIERLCYKPQIINSEVGSEIIGRLENITLSATLFFIDPWGYKRLPLLLIVSMLKSWGCDCIFFFNYNRVNMGLKLSKTWLAILCFRFASAMRLVPGQATILSSFRNIN